MFIPAQTSRIAGIAAVVWSVSSLLGVRADEAAQSRPRARTRAQLRAPTSIVDLRDIQRRVVQMVPEIVGATVNVGLGAGQGSGVIVTEQGHVLTAGHVVGRPGRRVAITLHDGRKVEGKTLGLNRDLDSGMLQITTPGPWPHLALAATEEVKPGDWCVAIGHPGGYKPDRAPVVRLGRVLFASPTRILTDCTLTGGDSGGPLVDLDGNVIGIHSQIGKQITTNLHVPIRTFRETWDRLEAGEAWGRSVAPESGTHRAILGIAGSKAGAACRVRQVFPNSPAAVAGIRIGDVIEKLDGQPLPSFAELGRRLRQREPGDVVNLEVQREDNLITLEIRLGRKQGFLPGAGRE